MQLKKAKNQDTEGTQMLDSKHFLMPMRQEHREVNQKQTSEQRNTIIMG